MLFDGIWYTPESQLCHTPKEKRPDTLRESDRYIWWGWRELNPRPKFLHTIYIIGKTIICFEKQCISVTLCLWALCIFNTLPPNCRQSFMRLYHHRPEFHPYTLQACKSLIIYKCSKFRHQDCPLHPSPFCS